MDAQQLPELSEGQKVRILPEGTTVPHVLSEEEKKNRKEGTVYKQNSGGETYQVQTEAEGIVEVPRNRLMPIIRLV